MFELFRYLSRILYPLLYCWCVLFRYRHRLVGVLHHQCHAAATPFNMVNEAEVDNECAVALHYCWLPAKGVGYVFHAVANHCFVWHTVM